MKTNVKPATIARIGALLVALANQCLAMFGKGVLPFTENMAYQVISLVAVVIIAAINAWYNNDISKVALLCGGVFDALSDGKITEEEIEKLLAETEAAETAGESAETTGESSEAEVESAETTGETAKNNFVISLINNIIKSIKSKLNKK